MYIKKSLVLETSDLLIR